MRTIDIWLQRWRIRKALHWIPTGARVLDIGCYQGELLESLKDNIGPSVGIDPLAEPKVGKTYKLMQDSFAGRLPFDAASFDVVVLLATIEHISKREELVKECRRVLESRGLVIITVPSPIVDLIVRCLVYLRLADGMSLEEHTGFDPKELLGIFNQYGFKLAHRSRFQLGCNYLMVFCKTDKDD